MIIGSKVYRTPMTNDSMAWAKEHIQDAPDGSVFLADTFGAARGRDGRVWSIYPGQLMVTIMLKPKNLSAINPDDLAIRLNQLNMAMSLGILGPLTTFGVQLKWPNDFVINEKKLGGILMHLVWHGTQPHSIIIGFALNINTIFQDDDPLKKTAISLAMETSQQHDIRALYKSILLSLDTWYTAWSHESFSQTYKAWKAVQVCLGKRISVHQKGGSLISGTAVQVLPNGDLMLLDEHRKQSIVSFYQVEEVRTCIHEIASRDKSTIE